MVTQTTDTVSVGTPETREDSRYRAQEYLWTHSTRPRGRSCGLRPTGGSVELRRTTNRDGTFGGFAGLQTCGSVWACPVCSAKVLSVRQNEVKRAVERHMSTGGRVAFLTFTVRHSREHALSLVWDAVQSGHHAITSGREHQREKEAFGIATGPVVTSCDVECCGERYVCRVPSCGLDTPGGRRHRPFCKEGSLTRRARRHDESCMIGRPESAVLPWLRVVEVTVGDAGWHVHQHMVVFLPAGFTDVQLAALYATWHDRWSRGAAAAGLDGARRVNVAKFIDSADAIGSYVTKNTYTPAELAGLEVARGDLKSGRFGNRSAMQLLRDVVAADVATPAVKRDRALWADFEQVSAGRRQMTWSTGARDLLGLGDERTDEEIAADELGAADDAVCTFEPSVFRAQVAFKGRRVELRRAVVVSPATALALLDAWGVPYDLPTVTERRGSVFRELRADPRDDDWRAAHAAVTRVEHAAVYAPARATTPARRRVAGGCAGCGGRLAPEVASLGRHVLC